MAVATGATLSFKPIGCPSYAPCYWGTLSSKPIGFVPSYACCCWSHEFQTHRICPLICSLLELSFKPRHSWCAVSPDLVMSSSQCSYMVFFVYRIVPFTDLQIQQIHSLLVWHSSVTWTMCPYKTLSVGTPYAWWPFMPKRVCFGLDTRLKVSHYDFFMIFLVTLAPENHQAWKGLQTHPASLSTNSLHSSQCWLSLLFWLKPQRVSMVHRPIYAHYIFTSNIFIYKLVGFLFYQTIAPISAVCVMTCGRFLYVPVPYVYAWLTACLFNMYVFRTLLGFYMYL